MAEVTRKTARDRLLDAADDLFYADGIQTVGVDAVIDRAGVAKASLYRSFDGKDDLVAEYLRARHHRNLEQLRTAATVITDPTARLLEVFVIQGQWIADPGYRGCPFTRAAAEAPADGIVRAAVDAYRQDIRALLLELVTAAGTTDPTSLTVQLELLFHGAPVLIDVEPRSTLVLATRTAAETLLRAFLPPHAD